MTACDDSVELLAHAKLDDRFADATELLHAAMELRVRHVATRIEKRGEKTAGTKKGRLRSFVRRAAFACILAVVGGLVYVNKESLAGYMEAIAAD